MEPIRQQDNSQKDFLASLFPEFTGDLHRSALDAHQTTLNSGLIQGQRIHNHQLSNSVPFTPPMDLLAMSNLMSMQGMDPNQQNLSSASTFTPQLLLEQQYKLTQLHQLQQLQNQIQSQIFQQQLALISGQTTLAAQDSSAEAQREQVPSGAFNGLPTPLSSTELRPLPDSDFLNRLNTPYTNSHQDLYNSQAMDSIPLPSPQEPAGTSYYMRHPGSASAPANIAFHMSPPFPLPSPSDLDIDVSPLTSPWLAASQQQPVRSAAKRAASPSAEDHPQTSRKRLTPASTAAKKTPRNAKSATSTPLLRSVKGRRNSTIAENDSPSPVDLSMPPPAPPGTNSSPPLPTNADIATVPSQEDTRITPVTPASIMNLGRLGVSSSLAPTSQASRGEPAKSKLPAETASAKGSRRLTLPLISPGPKPILPAGPPSAVNLSSSTVSQPVPQTRKSHKDAEQKRRDSLKTAYDDLRMLLPPIPLPSDENFPDEPILPGALPPRGPPKAGGDGPNKGVSKLQLLRCGNDYIRRLEERVDRRDKEIMDLRKEVLRLRLLAGDDGLRGEESIDLEKDLDAIEAGSKPLGQSSATMGEDDGDDGDE
ncbi:hypothetical protein F5J12DRAFT_813222 [Pisolithus orientalis]|uniref:uncharacterized protein n=1 Tax=Pisolithus orientalis TaxID=936130 RepID=UPI00222412DD|nr:uncharacterized protein F5J12DRAFT_813222 [Pisolithus orientalis]KAI6019795.1 hypothetical protein F5J12DRAFT_813222 [Pisolithus orientalis]